MYRFSVPRFDVNGVLSLSNVTTAEGKSLVLELAE